MNNLEIKKLIKKNHLFQYEVATEIGVAEFTLIRWLRSPLTSEQEERVLAAIKRLKERESDGE